ncbi:MAG: prepilin-type N-terminal cleavage/methylation domain-containing protein [Acidobacteria bacterium]|nr:prepilin-type N-terminal cleavage/methylation domain-containing protein [Acidobacteriota bacterium]
MLSARLHHQAGFSLIEMLAVSTLSVIVVGMSFPMLQNTSGILHVRGAARIVQSELQAARHKAVATQRPIRVRFECPAPGQFRAVELIGSVGVPDSADSATNRCSEASYPYPPADQNSLTRPNHDAPLRRLPADVQFLASRTIEFWPDGTAHLDGGAGNPWPMIGATEIAITVGNSLSTNTISINGLGRIRLQ